MQYMHELHACLVYTHAVQHLIHRTRAAYIMHVKGGTCMCSFKTEGLTIICMYTPICVYICHCEGFQKHGIACVTGHS